MTQTVEAAAAPGVDRARSGRRRAWIWPAAVAAAVVVSALATALLVPNGNREALDPRSPAELGTRAVAEVLRAHGVPVDVVETSDAAVDGAGRDDTIVVVRPELLGPRQLDRLAGTAADLVLVQPDLTVLSALAPQVTPAGAVPARSAEPGCTDPDAVAAGVATAGGGLYRVDRGIGCYPDAEDRSAYSFLRVTRDGRRITVLGQPEVLQNATLVTDGNAALALRTLGARAHVRWYLPSPAELGTEDTPTMSQLLPSWVRWVFWELVIATAVLLVWRARRLGRVVTEPLPVVVRSAETVEGRARLYRAGRSRGRAAAVLRTAALRRLATRLGVPPGAPPAEVVRVTAAATGRPEAELRDVLLGAPPRDDTALVALAGALDDVERSVDGSVDGPVNRYGDARSGGRSAGTRAGKGGRP